MKKLLIMVIVNTVIAVGISGCSSSSDTAAVDFTKSTVALSSLSQNVVTYENAANKSTHTDKYCPSGSLGVNNADGSWALVNSGNDLLVTPIVGTSYQYQTTGKLDVNASYNTTTGEAFKVTKLKPQYACNILLI